VEHRNADVRQVAGFAASSDDAARFLRELRQLRDGAGLGHAELAARAHFPYDSIRAAEVGPSLPDLPVLSAYVRGCGGTTEEWEERWRSLTRTPSLPVAASRNAGRSDAATAGARIGSQVGDNPDPSIIIAALNRVAEEMASPSSASDMVPDDMPSADDLLASVSEPVIPDEPAGWDTSDAPSGWDPIRVSSAWPVLRDAPALTDQPGSGAATTESSGPAVSPGPTAPSWPSVSPGTGTTGASGAAPWGTAPWASHPADADVAVTSAAASSTAPANGAAPRAARAPRAAAEPVAVAAVTGGASRAPTTTRVVVLAAVLLCVLAVLLAVFA
jgi:hypothetical protein